MRHLVLVLTALAAAGCNGDGFSSESEAVRTTFDRQALLRNLGENVIVPTYQAFDGQTGELVSAIQGHCAAVGSENEPSTRAAAQDVWRAAMVTWQQAEAFQIGPITMNNGILHARIYSWPVLSSCAVDQEVMRHFKNPDGYDLSGRLPNRRGLGALEYLLFNDSLTATCPPQATPVGWSELSQLDKRKARCGFAVVAAQDLSVQARTLRDAWLPGAGNYLAVLVDAGASGSPFPTAQAAVNVVSDVLFYVDSEVKDMKLARPAGITVNSCGSVGSACPADLESRFAGHGKQNVLANLRGLQLILLGQTPSGVGGIGFDDFLVAVDAPELATKMADDVANAIALVEAIPGTLEQAISSSPQAVAAAHAAIKTITDSLKSQFLTVLGLDIPDDAAADND